MQKLKKNDQSSNVKNERPRIEEIISLWERTGEIYDSIFNSMLDMILEPEAFADQGEGYSVIVSRVNKNGVREFTSDDVRTLEKSKRPIDRATSVRLAKALKRAMLK